VRVWVPIAYLLAGLSLLLPAFINRYPLFIGDSWRYLKETQEVYHSVSSQFYSYLIEPIVSWSVWGIVIIQAVLTVLVLSVFLRRVCRMSHLRSATVIALLGLASSLGFFVSGIMTDLMFGLGLIAAVTLVMSHGSRASNVALIGVVAYSAAAHPAALPMLGLVAILALIVELMRRRRHGGSLVQGGAIKLLIAVGLALVALTISNVVVWGKATPNPHSSVVTFAYLLGNGDLDDELTQCERWGACSLTEVGRFEISGFNRFLFRGDSPLQEVGGPTGFAGEAGAIVFEHIRSDPGRYLQRIMSSATSQLFMVDVYRHITDQMERMTSSSVLLLRERFLPGEGDGFASSLQYQQRLNLAWYSRMGMIVGTLGGLATVLGGLSWILNRGVGIPEMGSRLTGAIRIALVLGSLYVLHAAVIGAGTFPVPRYGARMLWLLALALWVLVFSVLPDAKDRVTSNAETSMTMEGDQDSAKTTVATRARGSELSSTRANNHQP
jgi:hypothetical protein